MEAESRLRAPRGLWSGLCRELHARTEGVHESGAFLLGQVAADGRRVDQVVYYDQLDPRVYDSGVCILHAASFGPLWDLCTRTGRQVVADIHVHEFGAGQSQADRDNPMIASRGHLALIVPNLARPPVRLQALGIFEYQGAHRWRDLGGRGVGHHLIIGD